MTQTVDLPLPSTRSAENKLVGGVCFAHFVSHYYIMLLAPLFLFVREDYGVTYTELGLALTAWNVVSTVLQTPTGFLVDRVNPRSLLIVGLVVGASAFAVAGLVNSFWVFVAMFAVAGIGNTVYHPADYALLSHHVPAERVGQVFSYHTFAGMVGNAVAPPTLLFMHSFWGWRGAFLGAAALGFVAAIILLWQGDPMAEAPKTAKAQKSGTPDAAFDGWRLLVSPPILLNLIFFILLSICGGGLNNYLVVALGAAHGTSPAVGNTALTALLIMSAVGVLIGGMFTGVNSRPGLIAAGGLIATALISVLVGMVDFTALVLVVLMSGAGFFSGLTMPSRDLIVRQVTPPGAFGRVFGFVSTGFNIGGIISPIIFGQLLDRGRPTEIFFVIAGCALLSIATVFVSTSQKRAA